MRELIREVGQQLDLNLEVRVFNSGIVKPQDAEAQIIPGAKEQSYGRSKQERPAAAAWTGTEGREGAANGPWPTGATAPLVGTSCEALYREQIGAITEAYPGTQIWVQREGLLLLSESLLVPAPERKAVFLTGIPFSSTRLPRSWGFWVGPPLAAPEWIGPRHTNFPDGSICAFHFNDGTWRLGESVVALLDLYTVWAFRHLYLQVLGSWPGRQVAHHPYERLTELAEDEYCGCDNSNKFYRECCRDKDKALNQFEAYWSFHAEMGGVRRPPRAVIEFIQNPVNPPALADLLPSVLSLVGAPTLSPVPILLPFMKQRLSKARAVAV